jgi:predicted acylesterase/phospholipase RssA
MVKHLAIGPGFIGYFALLGAVRRLADDGRLDNLEEMSGASAGGLTSFMYIASKGNFERVMNISLKISLKNLVKPHLKTLLSEYGIIPYDRVIKIYRTTLRQLIPGRTDITFKELYRHFPIKLHLAGYCIERQKTVYFSVDTDPDMSVLEALYITICVPMLFPARLYKGWHYIDGGVAEKTPCGPFLGKDDVMGIGLDYEKIRVFSDFKSYVQMILSSVQQNRFVYDTVKHSIIDMKDLDVFNFLADQELKMKMFVHGHESLLVS